MFFKMVKQLYRQGRKEKGLIFVTILFAASLISAVLTVSLDIGDQMSRQLKSYGSNIRVVPSASAGIADNSADVQTGQFLNEEEIGKIKTTFWTNNILNFTPYLSEDLTIPQLNQKVSVVGTWFQKDLLLPTGESMTAGIKDIKSWWDIEGNWSNEQINPKGVMIGEDLAKEINTKAGDYITLAHPTNGKEADFKIDGIISGGGSEDSQIFIPLKAMQDFRNLPGLIEELEVTALTVPDTELAEKADNNLKLLSGAEYELWYCTAFVGSITYQIEEAIAGSDAKAIRQISDSEGKILKKIEKLMFAFALAALASAALGISNLMLKKVMERKKEIGLMKALGASNWNIIILFLVETVILALLAGATGFALGFAIAQWIGSIIFNSLIAFKWLVLPVTLFVIVFVVVLASLSALRLITRLNPIDVLH